MKLAVASSLMLFLAAWAGMSLAADRPVEEITNFQRQPVEGVKKPAKPLKYRARYAQCRRLMQLKVKDNKGTYRHARRCMSKLRWRSTWAVGLTIRMVFPRSEWENAKAVATCENRGTGLDNRRARRGKAGERGHFQIHPIHSNWVDMDRLETDALYLTRVAHRIWEQAQWRPWTCATFLGIR